VRKLILRLMREVGIRRSPKDVGDMWEARFMSLARRKSLDVSRPASKSESFDFFVNGMRVQCKKRRILKSGIIELCFCARVAKGGKKKAYLKGEFDVLAVRCGKKTYLIPESALFHGDGERLVNQIRPENFSRFIDNWSIFLGTGVSPRPRQLSFLDQGPEDELRK
jgi:hypothetical protein